MSRECYNGCLSSDTICLCGVYWCSFVSDCDRRNTADNCTVVSQRRKKHSSAKTVRQMRQTG